MIPFRITIPWKISNNKKKISESAVLPGTFFIKSSRGQSVWYKKAGDRWLLYAGGRGRFFDTITSLLLWVDSFMEK